MSAAQKRRQRELRVVGVLKLVDRDVAEFILIVFPHVLVVAKQEHRLHNDIVKVKRVRILQMSLISLVDLGDLLLAKILDAKFKLVVLGSEQTVLCSADLGYYRLDGKCLLVDIEIFHHRADSTLRVVRIVYRKSLRVAESVAVTAEYAHTYRVERARPYALCALLVIHRRRKSAFYLVCRFVGKGYSQHLPRRARSGDKLGKYLLDSLYRRTCRPFELLDLLLGKVMRNILAVIRVAVLNEKYYSFYKHRGLAASRARKHKQRAVCGEHRFSLRSVQLRIVNIKQFALCAKIALAQLCKFCHCIFLLLIIDLACPRL